MSSGTLQSLVTSRVHGASATSMVASLPAGGDWQENVAVATLVFAQEISWPCRYMDVGTGVSDGDFLAPCSYM